jgi:hypothetical protein
MSCASGRSALDLTSCDSVRLTVWCGRTSCASLQGVGDGRGSIPVLPRRAVSSVSCGLPPVWELPTGTRLALLYHTITHHSLPQHFSPSELKSINNRPSPSSRPTPQPSSLHTSLHLARSGIKQTCGIYRSASATSQRVAALTALITSAHCWAST